MAQYPWMQKKGRQGCQLTLVLKWCWSQSQIKDESKEYLSKNIKGGKEKYRQKEDKTLIFTQNISFSDANLTILPHLYIYNLVFSSS